MKRAGWLYQSIPAYDNLCLAFWKAAKGKHDRQDVAAFRSDFSGNMQKLRDDLLNHDPDIGHYRFFQVRDPKPRSICAASFPERVLHHAIMNICEPVLEFFAIHDSYACRKGKGTHQAIAGAQKFARGYEWYLKLDVRKYFDSIDHEIMLRELSKRFKDEDLLLLFQKLFDTYHTAPGKGMPIGNLISQHLANFYLSRFDRWLKEVRQVGGYLRYMDDMLIFGQDKSPLKAELVEIRLFLKQELGLELKPNVQLNRCQRGIPFLGFRIFPYCIRLSPASRRRFQRKFRRYERKWIDGEWTEKELDDHVRPLIEFTKAADSVGLRRLVIERFGVSP